MSKISNPTKVITGVNTRWSYTLLRSATTHSRRKYHE